jgi:hypothetical protein
LKISVTQHHIDTGVRGNCKSDPIALALIDAGFKNPWVGPSYVRIAGGVKINLPAEAMDFIDVFDNRPEESRPFEFELSE